MKTYLNQRLLDSVMTSTDEEEMSNKKLKEIKEANEEMTEKEEEEEREIHETTERVLNRNAKKERENITKFYSCKSSTDNDEIITKSNETVSVVDLIKSLNLKNETKPFAKKPFLSNKKEYIPKADLLKYYKNNFLKAESNSNTNINSKKIKINKLQEINLFQKEDNTNQETNTETKVEKQLMQNERRETKNDDTFNNEDVADYAVSENKSVTRNHIGSIIYTETDSNNMDLLKKRNINRKEISFKKKQNILNELRKKIKRLFEEESNEIHNDLISLNTYNITHKKMYTIYNTEETAPKYYSCNDIIKMILDNKLKKNSLIKGKFDKYYCELKNKLGEIFFLKQMELHYYMNSSNIHNNISYMNNPFKELIQKENIAYYQLNEMAAYKKIKFLKNYLKNPNEKNIVEIVLIPRHNSLNDFDGCFKIISNLYVTMNISVYFYHLIKKKIETNFQKRKSGPLYFKIKLKTDFPEAIQCIFKYINNSNIDLKTYDFKLLIEMYIECINLQILCILEDITDAITGLTNFENIIRVLHLSSCFNKEPIFKDFVRILTDSAFYVFSKNYHYMLNIELFTYFLSSDNLLVNEMRICIEAFNYIIINKCNIKEQMAIFKNIRFSTLSTEYLSVVYRYIKSCFEKLIKYDCERNNHFQVNLIKNRKKKEKKKNKKENKKMMKN